MRGWKITPVNLQRSSYNSVEFSEHKRNKTLLLNYMYAFLVFHRPVRNIFEAGRLQLREVA